MKFLEQGNQKKRKAYISDYQVLGRGQVGHGDWLLMSTGFLFGMMKIFWNYTVLMVALLCQHTKSQCTIYFKGINFMVCELYLNFKNWTGKITCKNNQNTDHKDYTVKSYIFLYLKKKSDFIWNLLTLTLRIICMNLVVCIQSPLWIKIFILGEIKPIQTSILTVRF